MVYGISPGDRSGKRTAACGAAVLATIKALPLPFPKVVTLAWSLPLAMLVGACPAAAQSGALALGTSVFATNTGAIAIGTTGTPGAPTTASGVDSTALGNGATSAGGNAISIGTTSSAFNDGGIATGFNAIAGSAGAAMTGDIAIGTNAKSIAGDGVALGTVSQSTAQRAIAIGNNAIGNAIEAVAIGPSAWATGAQSVALGRAAFAPGVNSTSIGNGSSSAGFNSTALGYSATAGGTGGTALGDRSNAAGNGTVSVGRNSTANQAGSIAVGDLASATGNGAIALGQNTISSGAIVIGANAAGSGSGAIVGENASALGVIAGTALGTNTAVTVNDGVALGSGAKSSTPIVPAIGQAVSVAGAFGNVQVGFNTTDKTLLGGVSVGSATTFRQVSNVADAQGAFDAVNLRQLTSSVQATTTYTDVVAGNLQTQIATNATNIAINSTNIANNTTAITNIGARVNTLEPAVASLNKLAVRYTADANGNPTNAIALTGAGAGGAVTISNVAAGVAPTDAANVAQVQGALATANTYTNSVAANLQTQITGNATNIATNSANIAANTIAITSVSNRVGVLEPTVSTLNKLAVRYTADANGNPTNAITLTGAGAGGAVTISNVAAGVSPTDAANVAQVQGALTAANSYTNTAVGELSHRSLQYTTINGQTRSEINLNSDQGGPVVIHNLAAGVLATDAANVGQLNAVAVVANNSVQYDTVNGQRSNIVTLAGGIAGAPVTMRNVAAGVAATDAVNLAQMQQGDATAYANAVSYTDARVNNLSNMFNQRLQAMDTRVTNIAKDAQAGAAMALAATGLRYNDGPGKTTVAGASSIYRGQLGLAFGLGHTSQDGKWRVNAALSAVPTARKPDFGAVFGASYTLN